MKRRTWPLCAVLGALLAATSAAQAQSLGRNGSRITTNDYALDLTQGPVLESARVTSMAGAYVAIAEHAEGNAQNPASCAVRPAYSFDHFDYDLGLGVTFPSFVKGTDFFNTGKKSTNLPNTSQSQFVFLDLAANMQFGAWGFGLTAGLQQYGLSRAQRSDAEADRIDAQIGTAHVQVARGFDDGQLVIGTGLRTLGLSVTDANAPESSDSSLFSSGGVGFELGLLWRPNWHQLRVGASLHTAVTSEASPTEEQTLVLYAGTGEDLYLPRRVVLPWDFNFGFAVQLGPRPFNPRWIDPSDVVAQTERLAHFRRMEREKRRTEAVARARAEGRDPWQALSSANAELDLEAALDEKLLEESRRTAARKLTERYLLMKRFKVLISASMLMTGPVDQAVGVESFLERFVNRSGEEISLSPRLGIETEPIPNWLKVRAGTYLEPTRFRSNTKGLRQHLTAGFDVKAFEWTVFHLFGEGTEWRAGGSVDLARDYFGWGLSIGVWH